MTGKLTTLDVAVVVAYVVIVLAAGLFMGRFVKNTKDFFSGGKKVPWWMGAVSSYMAMISCFVFIAYAAASCSSPTRRSGTRTASWA